MTDTDFSDFDTTEAAVWAASLTPPETKIEPGEYPAKVGPVRTFKSADALWIEATFVVETDDPVEPVIAPIAAASGSPHAYRVVEGLRFIKALYACELRQPPADLKARHLTHFTGMPVILTIAVTERDGAARAIVRTFERRSNKGDF